ncbi:MAG: APC family permease [Brevibacterium aurantiacum]|uniref:Amino acid permease n=1 Tax=Brevibacterium aurantiacum TaxID=273384 RepID=A0A2A3X0S4_BREAU|nr:amino acid permease [Brevibacterium aurantiacum]MDN5594178.1 amino acid permease [Brevibacterium sp.]AZL10039.1 amino acid permease [Brevibacterium aurantiacum]AZL13695.1 amino acid permease [Brevibacterium aurantiacum]AZT94215.1 amino acid permease [Brevibacterium aurantiacum]MDN5608237.1 amino acid permease [Brevibacterium sp.]
MSDSHDTSAPQGGRGHHDGGEGQLKRALGVPSLVFFGLVYMVPLTIFTTYGIVTQVTGGRVPLAYVITLLAMVFTARSYAKMAHELPFAGSAYTYTQKSFGAGIGFVAGWALLLDYLFLPMINYLVVGIYLSAAFPMIPAWVFVLTAIVLVTALNVIGIVSVARANIVIIAAQAIFILTFAALGIASMSGSGTVDLMAPFTGDGSAPGFGNVMAGAAILCLSFLGFDAVSTLSEEAKDAQRTVPRAIVIATVTGGLIYIVLSFLSQLVYPSNDFADVDSGALDVMGAAGGEFLAIFFTAAYVAGACGSALTSQASVSRILFAMGRDGVLPKRFFGRLSPRFHTPILATLCVGVVSLFALAVDLSFISEMVSFGALIAFSAVNLSVIKHFIIDGNRRGSRAIINFIVLPGIGFCLTLWLWTSLSPRTLLIGAIWLALGIGYLAFVTRGFRRPTPTLDLAE